MKNRRLAIRGKVEGGGEGSGKPGRRKKRKEQDNCSTVGGSLPVVDAPSMFIIALFVRFSAFRSARMAKQKAAVATTRIDSGGGGKAEGSWPRTTRGDS